MIHGFYGDNMEVIIVNDIFGLYEDNAKGNGNYHRVFYMGSIGIMGRKWKLICVRQLGTAQLV